MNVPVDKYPSQPLSKIKERPIGTAKFKEPVFKLGVFQNDYIEVTVKVYPLSFETAHKKALVGVQFGEMNLLRFVDRDLLYDMEPLERT